MKTSPGFNNLKQILMTLMVLVTYSALADSQVAVLVSSFDPPTIRDAEMLNSIKKEGFDSIFLLPAPKQFSSSIQKFGIKKGLINEAFKGTIDGVLDPVNDRNGVRDVIEDKVNRNSTRITVYSYSSASHNLEHYIKKVLSPDDWKRGTSPLKASSKRPNFIYLKNFQVSSQRIRDIISQNPDSFFLAENRERVRSYLPAPVFEKIFRDGTYLGMNRMYEKKQLTKLFHRLWGKLNTIFFKLGIFEKVKGQFVKILHQFVSGEIPSIVFDSKRLSVIKKLGTGLSASTYLIEIDGKNYALKVAHNTARARQLVAGSIPIQIWFQKNEPEAFRTPKIYSYDPGGKWVLSELVEGNSFLDLVNDNKIPREMKNSIEVFLMEAKNFFKRTGISLDIGLDNLKIHNDKIVLVDTGPESSKSHLFGRKAKLTQRLKRYSELGFQPRRSCKMSL